MLRLALPLGPVRLSRHRAWLGLGWTLGPFKCVSGIPLVNAARATVDTLVRYLPSHRAQASLPAGVGERQERQGVSGAERRRGALVARHQSEGA